MQRSTSPPENWQLPLFKKREFHKRQTKYCLCIPIINEGKKFQKQIKQLKKYAEDIDIIIADGGSDDGSTNPAFLMENGVRTLLIMTSTGKQGTQLRMGISYALNEGYEGIITMDGNNKDGVNALPEFMKALDEGYDCVAGSRFINGGMGINTPIGRYLGIRFIASPLLSLAARRVLTDVTNGFKGYSRSYLLNQRVKPFRDIFVSYELVLYLCIRASQVGLKTKEVPVLREYPKGIIPTKIVGWKGQLGMLTKLLGVAGGLYNP